MSGCRIVFIGAGSAKFSANVVRDICLTEGLSGASVALVDTDGEKLSAVYRLATSFASETHANVRFEWSLRQAEVLEGADFVVDTALVGGHIQQEAEREVGERHGYYRGLESTDFNMVSDYSTLFQGYKQLKHFSKLAGDMERLCPDALLIDVANPEAEIVSLLSRISKIRVVGYCHGYLHVRDIIRTLGLEEQRCEYSVAGMNHNIWLTRFTYKGEDAYPLLDDWLERRSSDYWVNPSADPFDISMSRAAFDMYSMYDAFPVGDTVRSGTWKYHYDFKTKVWWYGPHGGPDSEASWPRYLKKAEEQARRILEFGEKGGVGVTQEFPPVRSGEEIVSLIDAVVNNRPTRLVLGVKNLGYVGWLPDNVAVEVPVVADASGVHPEPQRLPQRVIEYTLKPRIMRLEMAIDGFLHGRLSTLIDFAVRDPRTHSEKQAEETIMEILGQPFNSELRDHYLR